MPACYISGRKGQRHVSILTSNLDMLMIAQTREGQSSIKHAKLRKLFSAVDLKKLQHAHCHMCFDDDRVW